MGENLKLKGKMHNILCFVRKKRCKDARRKIEARSAVQFSRRAEWVTPENRLLLRFLGSGWE
jgi:hypothetical protein